MAHSPDELLVKPIGWVRSPFGSKLEAPRQAVVAGEVTATIELLPGVGFEDALSDLASFDRIWVIYWFHLNTGWKPKVLPPRSNEKRGLFATRAPHRPNPIGMSAVRLEGIDGLTLHIRGADMVDQTPVIDIKPYVAYADSFADAKEGWLADPAPVYSVRFEPEAETQLAWLASEHRIELRSPLVQALSLGPAPHAYRRIKRDDEGLVMAHKSWRVRFRPVERAMVVTRIVSGHRTRDLEAKSVVGDPDREKDLEVHRAFVGRFS